MAFGNMLNKLSDAANKGADFLGKASESIAVELQEKAARNNEGSGSAPGSFTEGVTATEKESDDAFAALVAVPFEPIKLASWAPVNAETRQFELNDELLDIDAEMDAYNGYRRRFYDYAKLATDAVMMAYSENVHDLESYLNFFPSAYEANLDAVIDRAIDALVSSGIYTVTAASFKERHITKFHSFGDVQAMIAEGVETASQANRQVVEGVANLIMRSSSSGGILSDALHELRDTYKSNLIENATKINPEQAKKLFELIEPGALARLVLADYWSVHFTLVNIMIEEGKQIWWLSDDQAQRAQNIFQNLSNPNFPQDQLTAMLIQILKSDPYRKEYHQYMLDRFGETHETVSIREYFGIDAFDDFTKE